MRYEDLKVRPKETLEGLFCFLLDVHTIEGTFVEKRIADFAAGGFETKTTYALKDRSLNLDRNRHMYSQE